ncbi:glycoside hydrolase family 53 protein [Lentinula boryana]|uniref:Arabinogalactan endo-beta-1,4-galactanase n=3 Tax=Lentinula TaxID=5352 RepID=A0AA38KF50_9AGAR|nr:glycoside hydrolase family 53 protein [Lentinula aff. detonsa]KAJ3798632.1 glycoside hydrolase family 53 protein [Lentinula aff. detonsa]KAJ3985264.1 glycoside hydrolase family 53 protein [Lentinula detonsa]KAJ3998777.1 glycoside hydrolase family 53 protein [Lentinula boryana]
MFFQKTWQSLVLLVSLPLGNCLTYHGADYSSLVNLEDSGITYKDSGTSEKFDTILANHGVNLARIRIWTSTNDADYSLDYGLALAERAVAAGMSLLIDLHYSDTWADPGDQATPSSWPTDLDGLNTEIYDYTNSLVTAFANQGTPIDFLQIGNEINSGILFPTGEISVNGYSPLSQLLHSAANGAHDASDSVKIVVHLANGWDGSAMSSFYEQIFIQGEFATTDFDVMGFSFYPFYDSAATYSALQSSLDNLVATYGKDVMIVETDWPSSGSCSGVTLSEDFAISTSGQESWVSGITEILAGLSDGHGLGVVYWEPGWIGNDGLGSGCSDNLVVDDSGNTLASIDLFSADM